MVRKPKVAGLVMLILILVSFDTYRTYGSEAVIAAQLIIAALWLVGFLVESLWLRGGGREKSRESELAWLATNGYDEHSYRAGERAGRRRGEAEGIAIGEASGRRAGYRAGEAAGYGYGYNSGSLATRRNAGAGW